MSIFLRVTLPLAGVNFLNQASRAVIATIGPALALEFGLSASQLGLLAAIFFATYALAQLPVGLALDLFGPSRVQSVLALVAAAGFALCAFAGDTASLGLGRAITGLGIAAGLMALIKAAAQWYPRERMAAMAGLGVFIGAAGGLCATLPAQLLLPHLGWRGLFLLLAGFGCGIALWIRLAVPLAPPGFVPPPRRGLGQDVAEFGRIFAHPVFLRFVPAIALLSAMNFTYQGLWAGPWLRDVGLLGDAGRASILFTYALGLMAGSLVSGQLASLTQRHGHDAMLMPYIAVGGVLLMQAALVMQPSQPALLAVLWFLFSFFGACGPVGYAAVAGRFGPELAGRVSTAINAAMLAVVFLLQNLIGVMLDLWPRTASGGWQPDAYSWALGITMLGQAASVAWLLAAPRLLRR